MGRIPQETIDEIVRRQDLVGVIGRYTQLKKRGREYLGLCPFHGEKTPSFYVNPEKAAYFCHGCKEGGGLFHFVQKIENRSFVEAVVKLGEEVGIKVELDEKEDPQEAHRRHLFEILERTSHYYNEMLLRSPTASEAREYLARRSLTPNSINKFRLGWAPAGGTALLAQLKKSGYAVEDGLAVGVLSQRQGRVVDTLRGRVIFPIFDIQDRVLAMGGRVLDSSQPKYLNTPETELYSKRTQLYALGLHRQAISKQDRAVVAEGYLDVIMLDQVGVNIAVASLGTSLTEEQAKLLRRFTSNVVLAYDSDKAGQNATVRGIELFELAGLRVHIAPLPPGEDPDSLARNEGQAGVQKALDEAVGVVDFHMAHLEKQHDLTTPEGKEDYSKKVLPVIEKIQDAVRKNAYVVRLANKLGVTESQLSWRLTGRKATFSQGSRSKKEDEHNSEVKLFRVCAHYPELLQVTREQLSLESLAQERMKPLFAALFAGAREGCDVNLQDLLPHIEEASALHELTELLILEPPPSSLEDVQKLLKSITDNSIRLRWESLRRDIVEATAAGTIDADDERFQEYRRLQRLLKGAQ